MIPSIEHASDDWVGFMVATATMWESFCVMVEHPEWIDDQRLYAYAGRALRRPELEAAIREWVGRRTAAEVLEMADLLRVPAAPMGNGAADHGARSLRGAQLLPARIRGVACCNPTCPTRSGAAPSVGTPRRHRSWVSTTSADGGAPGRAAPCR